MIKSIITSVFVFGYVCFFAQLGDTTNLRIIKDSLVKDQISYEQFLLLGKCNCQDIIEKQSGKESLYAITFAALYDLRNPIPRLFEKNSVSNYFKPYLDSSLDVTLSQFRTDDEYYSHKKSSVLTCEKIYRQNDFNKLLYIKFISNYSNYNLVLSNRLEYVKKGFIQACTW